MRRVLAASLVGVALALLPAAPASAHPLGNFTVNSADRVLIVADGVQVLHVIDLAEIPTVQLRGPVRAAGGLGAYATAECTRVAPLLDLTLDGSDQALEVGPATAQERPGAAGLATTRIECSFHTATRPLRTLEFTDGAIGDRVGWKELTIDTRCGSLRGSDVPRVSPSRLLTAYPNDLLTSPLAVRSGHASVVIGACAAAGATTADVVTKALPRGVGGVAAFFTDFLGRRHLTVGFAVVSLLAALAFGVVHALAPGHGKTVMAAYLVGQRGTRRQALQLGAVVTFTHTASVLLLGGLLTAGALAAPERVVPVTEVLSGLLLVGLGAYLLLSARRRSRHQHSHDAEHGHEHPHDHGHGGLSHSHGPVAEGPLGWRSLAGMGVAGGLVPSPSALVVLLGATALGRAWFGVLLVLAYGAGMAVTLTGAGLLLLRAQSLLDRRGWTLGRGRRIGRLLPVGAATIVMVVGAALVARGFLTGRTMI